MRKPYVQVQRSGWWLHNPAYRRYMLREGTAIPLFLYCLLLILGVWRLSQGEAAFGAWLAMLHSPGVVALHLLALAAALFHAWTWIELVPKILVLDKPPLVISGMLIKRGHQLLAIVAFIAVMATLILALPDGASSMEG